MNYVIFLNSSMFFGGFLFKGAAAAPYAIKAVNINDAWLFDDRNKCDSFINVIREVFPELLFTVLPFKEALKMAA